MNLAMVLPLFSEYCLREYLGIELLVKALKESDYQVHCIDLNEKLVDYLLSNKAILHEMFLSEEYKAQVQTSPHSKYFELYLQTILKYDTAQSLKKDGLYDNFFKAVILYNFAPGISPDESLLEKYHEILDSMPVIRNFLNFTVQELMEKGYDTVLLSVPHAHQLIHALLLSKTVKSFDSDVTTIMGGSTVTLSDDAELEKYVKDGFIDFYIKYSGEDKLLGLLVDLEEKEEIDQAALIKSEYVDINRQTIVYRPEFDRGSVPVIYSRGCYWGKCSYCTYVCLDTGKFTRKKQDVLLAELEQFSGKPVRVSLITESLTPHDAKIIAEGILARNIKIRWGSFIRVNQNFDSDLFALLKKSGCIFSCVGLETVNDKVLDFLNKGYAREDVYAFFRSARKAKFQFFQVNFMYGTPVANLNDELDAIAFISEFRDVIGNIAHFHLEITKKSYLGKHLQDLGIKMDRSTNRRSIRVDNIPFKPSLNEKELMLVERSYGISGEYFKMRDINVGLGLFLKQEPQTVPLRTIPAFEFNGQYYAGALKSLLLREISPKLFAGFKSSGELEIEDLTGRELFTLFELGIVDTEEIIWDRS